MRTESTLGSRLVASVEVFLTAKDQVEADCFRLYAPSSSTTDLPWVRRGKVEFHPGKSPRLLITSAQPINEPAVKLALQVGCGYDLRHDYTILLSPPSGQPEPDLTLTTSTRIGEADEEMAAASKPQPKPRSKLPPPPSSANAPASGLLPLQPTTPRVVRVDADQPTKPPVRVSPYKLRQAESLDRSALPGGDRLVLSTGSEGSRNLRMSGFLNALPEEMVDVTEARREVLRLEYRLFQLRNEPGVPADKMAELESVLASLHQGRAAPGAPAAIAPTAPPQPVAPPPAPAAEAAKPVAPPPPAPAPEAPAGDGEFPYYLIFALLGLFGLLGWREYSRRRPGKAAGNLFDPEPETPPEAAPALAPAATATTAAANKPVSESPRGPATARSAAAGQTSSVPASTPSALPPLAPVADIPLPALNGPLVLSGLLDEPEAGTALSPAAGASAAAAEPATPTVNPVMELAEIMLSFGRVKGAAQALQEYIDGNPKQALQPWIKLLDVYRMAGMREEFEAIAANLNQHFNVEILMWDTPMPGAEKVDLAFEPLEFDEIHSETPPPPTGMQKALTIENIPHIRDRLVQTWRTPACLDYLYQLLRDNRGGTRSGFTLPVVQELLFMIELLEFDTKSTYNTEETGETDE